MYGIMGDATAGNAEALARYAQSSPLAIVAGYDTGPGIMWGPAQWALFPGVPQVHIDQADGSLFVTRTQANVFDIEPGAWTPAVAGMLIAQNRTPRPTVYCDRSQLAETVAYAAQAPNWLGDVWLSYPDWLPGQPLPALEAPGRYVAVQNQLGAGGGAYDLSVILDPTWPALEGDPMGTGSIIVWGPENAYLLNGGRAHHITPNELAMHTGAGVPQAGSANGLRMSAAEETAFLADYPPGNPAVTVNTAGTLTIAGTVTAS